MRKIIILLGVLVIATSVATAKMDRTLYTKENRFPELYRPEIGVLYQYSELEDGANLGNDSNPDLATGNIFTRIHVLEELNLRANVPFSRYSPSHGDDHDGLGDVSVGADLIAYQDILDYPFIIPHIDYTFDTGDEDEHLGKGESYTTVGIGAGTVVDDQFHWLLDLGYNINDKNDNNLVVGASFLWEISDRFAVLAETQFVEKPDNLDYEDSYAQYYTGGFTYEATDNITIGVYGTEPAHAAEEDIIISAKASLSL